MPPTPRRKSAPVAPSSPDAWKLPVPRTEELPSGLVMTLRPGPCMNRLVREGVIPNPLLGAVVDVDEEGGVKSHIDWKQREEHRAAIVCSMAVEPPVTMEPFEGAVVYDALDERDIEFIVTMAQEGTPELARFRSE